MAQRRCVCCGDADGIDYFDGMCIPCSRATHWHRKVEEMARELVVHGGLEIDDAFVEADRFYTESEAIRLSSIHERRRSNEDQGSD